jgi:UDP-N-acetylglucosamine:LPS N-acetylglucosamine transferase
MRKLNNVVFFASNEGGHFSQLIALHDLFSKYETVVVTDNSRADKSNPALKNVKAIEFAMAFADYRVKLKERKEKNMTHWSYLPAYWDLYKQCNRIWKKYRPKVVISTGSNIAVPLAVISKLNGSKFIYIETRAKVYNKTISGRLIGGICDKVIVQWPEMVDVYKGKAEYYGTLV